jgi:hypothetical protein
MSRTTRVSLLKFAKARATGLGATLALLTAGASQTLWRRLGILVFVALALTTAMNFARATPRITTDADFAVTEIYTRLATEGRLVDGPYSRFGWHHPGPLYFYLQAPLYAVSGYRAAALYVGALGINLTALLLLAWVIGRHNHGPLLPLLLAACVAFAWRAPRFLASPWTAHVPVLPAISFLALSAATASGRPWLLPATVLVGSFVAQTHVAFVPIIGGLCAGVLALWFLDRRPQRRSLERILNASAWLCVALWLLPIIEALSNRGGNFVALLCFFVVDGRQTHTFAEALSSWSYGLTGVFQPDFALPWGGHFIATHLWWAIPCSVGQLLALAGVARRDRRSGRRFEACLAVFSLVACISGLWALTRIQGDIVDHEIFWLAPFGAVNVAIISAAGFHALQDAGLIRCKDGTRIWAAACALALLVAVSVGVRDLRSFVAFELRRSQRTAIPAAHESIRRYIREHDVRSPLIKIEGSVWSVAAGVLVGVQQDGTPFAVTREWVPMFTDAFAATGREDAVITIGTAGHRRDERPGSVLLLENGSIYVEAMKIAPGPLQ